MNWNMIVLITYAFLLGLALLLIAFLLYVKLVIKAAADNEQVNPTVISENRNQNLQQIERIVKLHQDVKDDLSNYGEVLVAMRNDALFSQAYLQSQIDICMKNIQTEQKKPSLAEGEELRSMKIEKGTSGIVKNRRTPTLNQQAEKTAKVGYAAKTVKSTNEKSTISRKNESSSFSRMQVPPNENPHDLVIEMICQGMATQKISQKTGFSRSEIDLIESLIRQTRSEENN